MFVNKDKPAGIAFSSLNAIHRSIPEDFSDYISELINTIHSSSTACCTYSYKV